MPSVPSYSFNTNCSAASPAQIHAALSSVLCLSSPGANHQYPHAKQMDGTPAVLTGDAQSFQQPHIALMKDTRSTHFFLDLLDAVKSVMSFQ